VGGSTSVGSNAIQLAAAAGYEVITTASPITSNVALQFKSRFRGTRTKYIFGTTLKANEVSKVIYRDFLPDALAGGRYVAAAKPSVVGHGVQDFQRAMDIQLKGVSAAKVVVTLP
jgi:hypothetical protein